MRNAARASDTSDKRAVTARASRQMGSNGVGSNPGSNTGSAAGSSARRRKPIGRPHVMADDAPAPKSASGQRRRVSSDVSPPDAGDTSPRFTLPSIPLRRTRPHSAPAPAETRGHRTLLSGRRAEQALREAPSIHDDRWDQAESDDRGWDRDSADELPRRADPDPYDDQYDTDDYDTDDYDTDDYGADDYDAGARLRDSSGRLRATSAARPLPAVPRRDRTRLARAMTTVDAPHPLPPPLRGEGTRGRAARLSTASVPDLVAYHPPRARAHVDTRAIIETARKPWSVTRISLALLAAMLAIITTHAPAGESPQPLMFFQAAAGAGPDNDAPWPINAVTSRVQPETQLTRIDQYESVEQMNLWGPADCSAAALSEILTAYGVPNATIGRMVADLGPDISPNGGLMTYDGFNKVAQLHGLRADLYMDKPLTYKQMQYLTNTLGIPVIVNVHIAYGYYRFFAGGHFLVMTYGDDQGLRLVDSSEYYVKYMPIDVFNSMFTHRTAVIVPKDYQYTLPS